MLRFLQRDAISVEKEKISQILNQTSIFSIPAGVWEAMAGTKVWFIWGPSYLTSIIVLPSYCVYFLKSYRLREGFPKKLLFFWILSK